MALKFAKAEDIRYSIADRGQFEYLSTRLGENEQKAFEEIGERIGSRADKKMTKREILEIFKKHVESAYHGDLVSLDNRLTHILKYFVDDGCLEVEVTERKLVASKTVQGKMEGKEEFFRRMVGEDSYLGKITDNWSINIPVRIARSMGLEGGMPCKLGWEGDSLTLTPLKETEMPVKIRLNTASPQDILGGRVSLIVGISANMLVAGGLKLGDYAAFSEKDGLLCLMKADKGAPYARKIQRMGSSVSVGTTIPAEIARKAHVEPGQYGFWTFEDDGLNKSLWLETGGARNIAKITKIEREYGARFIICIPDSMKGTLEKGDEVVLEMKEGKLYLTKKQLES